ncbi:hypothetical protein KP509_31G035800 [Ceratopteris richardii]|uniref:Uncharacterized protein n=1 Tax=Ceratopteris richardii TaxID=49495 RepID=A0A8T2QZA8_CERRI|nr:hypothetical protein KP509_31G035800 [Ceratopteris richardii]
MTLLTLFTLSSSTPPNSSMLISHATVDKLACSCTFF